MQNILLLSPSYPGPGLPSNSTPVVHYFAKEWVKLGYNVHVVTCPSNFPLPVLWLTRLFHSQLESWLNLSIRVNTLDECEYDIDEIPVLRVPLQKVVPHSRYNKSKIKRAVNKIVKWCENKEFVPDVIIGHWTNPNLDMLPILKEHYKVPIALILHDSGANIESLYKEDYKERIALLDAIGYRSDAIKRKFEQRYGAQKRWFYCHSGAPQSFVEGGNINRDFKNIRKFVFVGMMISRKYPLAVLEALQKSAISNFDLTYIGDGAYVNKIESVVMSNDSLSDKVHLLGRIDRTDIKGYLAQSDVFVMISKNETFGLVYLEAMAMGCITIASRDEGFDGIIRDGENGFLCKAGDVDGLVKIINKINQMSPNELQKISHNAITTARKFTDKEVAKRYIEDVINIVKS